jgi:hypothetical protein
MDKQVFADPGYENSDYDLSASGRSTSSSETRPEESVSLVCSLLLADLKIISVLSFVASVSKLHV